VKRVIVRYLEGEEQTAWLQPYDDMLKNRELARPAYRDPDTGEEWVTDAERLACNAFFALKRAGLVSDGEFMSWYQRVDEIEPRLSHTDVEELVATGQVRKAEAEYLHRRVEELGDGAGESQAPPSL
jgi:hypothetical protein